MEIIIAVIGCIGVGLSSMLGHAIGYHKGFNKGYGYGSRAQAGIWQDRLAHIMDKRKVG